MRLVCAFPVASFVTLFAWYWRLIRMDNVIKLFNRIYFGKPHIYIYINYS